MAFGNLFDRSGHVRGVPCLMLWNRCENWEGMSEKLLALLDVPDGGLITLGNAEQWWVRVWKGRKAFRRNHAATFDHADSEANVLE